MEEALGCTFADKDLLVAALRHRSYVAESSAGESNERLEFLGDAVLSIVVTDHLYRTWPDKAEGPLAKARAAVVSAEHLAELAVQLDLGPHLRLGRGEAASGGREKPSILADALEAVIGAVYIDGGIEAARTVVLPLVVARLAEAVTGEGAKDFKTRLQEYTSQHMSSLPRYEVEAFGPDHAKEFTATVEVAGRVVGRGHGRSKKQAEQSAARSAWGEVVSPRADPDIAPGAANGPVGQEEANEDHA
ncbi:MAG: ribonuclease III [Acidimicrobiia bacterium]|nr:ribonuclease III [Acidimicrobiia bacterium]